MRNAITVLLLALATASGAVAQPATAKTVSTAQIGKMLKELGYQPEALTDEVWQVTIKRDSWKVHIMISLSPDGDRIWLECKFAVVADPEIIPAASWFKLLAANERIGPAYFAFDKSDSRIHLYKAFDAIALVPTRLKSELESFDATVRKTQSVWRSENFAPSEVLPVPPRTIVAETKQRSALEGVWRIVRVESKGESITEDKLLGLKPRVVIQGDSAVLRTGLQPERTVRVRIDATQQPKSIDFLDDNNTVEEGIYNFEAGLLTICVAGSGEARPRQFVTDPKNKLWLLVLKRDE